MAQQTSAGAQKPPTIQYVILAVLVVLVVVGGGWFFLSGKEPPPPAPAEETVASAEGADEGGAAGPNGTEAEESDLPERDLEPAEMQIESGQSPFRPKEGGGIERPGVARPGGRTRPTTPREIPDAEDAPDAGEGEDAGDGEDGEEAAADEGEDGSQPRRITPAPGQPRDVPPATRPGGNGTATPPVTPPPPGTQPPGGEVEVVSSEPDRTSDVFMKFASPGTGGGDLARPSRSGQQELQVTGTIVGADGGTTAIITDGTRPYYVRQGQQLSVQGKPMRVLSIDRGSVTLESGRETVTLQSIGGAGQ
ncbi:MAG: hypothetical protein GF320_21080 [Armatimonadia bacterium]|nr:hypothetical protein [Armatimonadia bacterium]